MPPLFGRFSPLFWAILRPALSALTALRTLLLLLPLTTTHSPTPTPATPDTVVLGGTLQAGDWDTAPREEDRAAILERCYALLPSLRAARVVRDWVSAVCAVRTVPAEHALCVVCVEDPAPGMGSLLDA